MRRGMLGWLIITILGILSIAVPLVPITGYDKIEFDDELTVMTYNTHFGIDTSGQYSIDRIIGILMDYKPHVLLLQEVVVDSPVNGYIDFWRDLVKYTTQLGYGSHYLSEGNYILNNGIISKYPLISAETFAYSDNHFYLRSLVRATLDTETIPIDVYSTHIAFSHIDQGKAIRLQQIQEMVTYLSLSSNSVILGGDMNDYDNSTGYETIVQEYNDSWSMLYSSEGFTSPATDPIERIDYLFISSDLIPVRCEVIENSASDHFPLLCEYTI